MVLDDSTICVLGGGGFLGSHLVSALLERTSLQVRALDLGFEKLQVHSSRLGLIQADIAEAGVIEEVVSTCSTIVSTTALCNPSQYNTMPLDVIDASFTHLLPLVRLCTRSHRRLLHFSTCEVYGKAQAEPGQRALPMSEDTTDLIMGPVHKERWCYATAKQLLERLIWAQGVHHGLEFSIIRPFNVIGPRMDFIPGLDGQGIPRVLANFMNSLLRNEPLPLVDGGENRRSFISVHDFVDAILKVVEFRKESRSEIFNIGHPGNDVSIAELAQRMISVYEDLAGRSFSPGVAHVSSNEFYGEGYEDTTERVPDISKAERLLGWSPTRSLDDMLPEIVEDYVSRYKDRLS